MCGRRGDGSANGVGAASDMTGQSGDGFGRSTGRRDVNGDGKQDNGWCCHCRMAMKGVSTG